MNWQAQTEHRCIVLTQDGAERMRFPLDQGGRFRLIAPDMNSVHDVVDALEELPAVGVLVANGGLLGAKTVAENIAIVLHYGTDARDNVTTEWEDTLNTALRLAGMTPERIAGIGRELPMNLSRTERWLLGFVRCVLRPPELLVFDRIFSGLTRREAEALVALETLFHEFHPFRPVLFVDLDTHELPVISDCRQECHIEETPCLC